MMCIYIKFRNNEEFDYYKNVYDLKELCSFDIINFDYGHLYIGFTTKSKFYYLPLSIIRSFEVEGL